MYVLYRTIFWFAFLFFIFSLFRSRNLLHLQDGVSLPLMNQMQLVERGWHLLDLIIQKSTGRLTNNFYWPLLASVIISLVSFSLRRHFINQPLMARNLWIDHVMRILYLESKMTRCDWSDSFRYWNYGVCHTFLNLSLFWTGFCLPYQDPTMNHGAKV